ncbi:MAG: tRNA pseudouridine(55) synthase TruB [Planctomycetota bacterium]
MFGLINLDKPSGISSRAAINAVHRVVKPAKIGHCGTLDPLASGVLVACIGPATRLANFVQQSPKTYVGDFRLGCESDSEDIETDVREIEDAPVILAEQLESILGRFLGNIQQVPPAFSALKVNGKRAYRLARKGKEVKMKPRTISINSIRLLSFEYPNFSVEINCGAGTYIRSLGRDIGRALGSGAVMTALKRTRIGAFQIEHAISPDDLTRDNLRETLTAPLTSLDHIATITLTSEQQRLIQFGGLLKFDHASGAELAATDEQQQLLAVLRRRDDGQYAPAINFVGKN